VAVRPRKGGRDLFENISEGIRVRGVSEAMGNLRLLSFGGEGGGRSVRGSLAGKKKKVLDGPHGGEGGYSFKAGTGHAGRSSMRRGRSEGLEEGWEEGPGGRRKKELLKKHWVYR